MKKQLLFWSMLIGIFTIGNAQIDIPDFNFKQALLNNPNVNTIDDGEISLAEAKAVTELNLSYMTCCFNPNPITNISGIEFFSNLEILTIYKQELSSVDISENINLKDLNLVSNNLTTIDVSNNTKLEQLSLSYNDISQIDITNNTELLALNMYDTNLTIIDVSKNTKLQSLSLLNNELTEIDVTNNPELSSINLLNNNLSEIDLSNNSDLMFLRLEGNEIETLDIRSLTIQNLDVSNNSNLKTIFMTGQKTRIWAFPGESYNEVFLNNCPQLEFICVDEQYVGAFSQLLVEANQASCMVTTDCSLSDKNRIQGNITYDTNGDGCGNADDVPFIGGSKVSAVSLTTGESVWVYPNEVGIYNLFLDDDTYFIGPLIQNTNYYTFSTPIVPSPTLVPGGLATLTTDYCVQSIGNFNDLEITIVPTTRAVPGFEATYQVTYTNVGTTTQSGTITLDYDSDVLTFSNSTSVVTSNSNGTLNWGFSNLQAMESGVITVYFTLNTPMDSPALNSGDILDFTVTVNEAIDETPDNNIMELAQTVVNSYDPNDKTCLEGDILDPDDVGGYLHYLIRFENEGTAEAVNIRIVDLIDTTKLDIESFVPLKSSHSYTTSITNESEVEFNFTNINLPFDDVNNDGYVFFKIRSLNTLVEGDEIINSAAIYFDFNFPILTENSVVTVEKKKAQGIYFPDPNFKNALLNYAPAIDTDDDGEISIDEAENVERLALSSKGITSVEGIEYFTNLNFLNLYVNAITEIDLSNNINLSYLYIARNALTEIDVSSNINLTHLYLASNSLKDIDVSNNTNLTTLAVGDNPLTKLNVSNNTNLVDLNTLYTNLTGIDVSNNTKLTKLSLDYCNITDIDVSNNINLKRLSVSNNELTTLDVRACSLIYINFSNNPNLETVYMTGQPIEYLGERLSMNLGSCPNLNFICADQKYLIDISKLLFDAGQDTCTLSDDCSTNSTLKTWTGIVSNDWDVKENWDTNTLPKSNDDVLIPAGLINYPTATSPVSFNKLTLEPGTSFIPKDTVEGQITYKVNLSTIGWYGVTAPVEGETYENLIANHAFANGSGTNVGVASYNNDKPGYDYQTTTSTGTIPVGKGMIMKLQEAGEVSFTGTMITGDFDYEITQGARNFNLIGNPYTSYINSTDFFNENSHLLNQQTIWIYDGSKYVTHNLVNPIDIAPGQAFFVSASTDGFVRFKESNQNHQETTSSKKLPVANFELSINSNHSSASTKVMYLEEKTIGFDNGYDSKMFNDPITDLTVYTELPTDVNSNRLSLQTLPLDNTHAIPVGLIANAGKEITFSVTSLNLPENTVIYLEDRKKGKFVDLSVTEYKTTLEKNTDGTGQFYIHTDVKEANTKQAAFDNISIYRSAKNEATIAGLDSDATITILSLSGKKVLVKEINQDSNKISLPNLTTGVYIVKVSANSNQVIRKIVLD